MNIASGISRSTTHHRLIRNTSISNDRPVASMVVGPTNILVTPLVVTGMLVILTIVALAGWRIPSGRIVGWLWASDGATGGIEARCSCIVAVGSIPNGLILNCGASVTAVLSGNSLVRWRIILNF
jgi:hypothetical protein